MTMKARLVGVNNYSTNSSESGKTQDEMMTRKNADSTKTEIREEEKLLEGHSSG